MKYSFLYLFLLCFTLSFSQSTEDFETGLVPGATSFTNSGRSFTLSNDLIVVNDPGNGVEGSDWYLGHASCVGRKGVGSVSTTNGDDIHFRGISLYISKDCGNTPANKRVKIFWFKDGVRKSAKRLDINSSTAGGYVYVDFSSLGNGCILSDSIVVQAWGETDYFRIDNFSWNSAYDHVPSKTYNVLVSEDFSPEEVTYQWYNCTDDCMLIEGETNITFVAEEVGSYSVEVTDGVCPFLTNPLNVQSIAGKSSLFTENFESNKSLGDQSFTTSGRTFQLDGDWAIDNFPFYGVDTTDWYIDNFYTCIDGATSFEGSISLNGKNIYLENMWVYVSNDCAAPNDGELSISWFIDGEEITTRSYQANCETSLERSNGYVNIDFSSDGSSDLLIDSIVVRPLGGLTYIAIDDISWTVRVVNNQTDNVIENVPSVVYPNPFNDFINVSHPELDNGNIKLVNAIGDVVVDLNTNNQETIINTSNLDYGVYYIRVTGDNYNSIIRVLK